MANVLPEYQAFFMKTATTIYHFAVGANNYCCSACSPSTNIEDMAEFVSRYLINNYVNYTTGYDPNCNYEKTYTEETKNREIENWKRRKKNRVKKSLDFFGESEYLFWITFEKTQDGFECQYWTNADKETILLSDLDDELIRSTFINAYRKSVRGIHYSSYDNSLNQNEKWELQQYAEEALVCSQEDDWLPIIALMEKLISLSKHADFNLENAEDFSFSCSSDIVPNVVRSCAKYNKNIGKTGDDEFVVDALEKCLSAGILSVILSQRNNVDFSMKNGYEVIWKLISDYDLIQNWREHLLQDEYFKSINDITLLEDQLIGVVQFLYSLSAQKFKETKSTRQLEECYDAAYLYGQRIGMFFGEDLQ